MKNIKAYLVGAAAAFTLVGIFAFSRTTPPSETAGDKKTHRLVFQITTPDTAAYRALSRQLNNVLAHWPAAQIEVVAHNKGIGLLEKKKSNVPAEIEALKAKGVQFVACEQTLKQLKLQKTDILPEAGFVERGIVHVVERQEQGWSYLKAGF
ncbi:MAG: DsrE family protein [Saprospiraceae bacterium]|nr:DsrE family protein [Saprospiraceae bacterium]